MRTKFFFRSMHVAPTVKAKPGHPECQSRLAGVPRGLHSRQGGAGSDAAIVSARSRQWSPLGIGCGALQALGKHAYPSRCPPTEGHLPAHAEGFRLAVETGQRETQAAFFPKIRTSRQSGAAKAHAHGEGADSRSQERRNLAANPAQLKGVLELSGGGNYEIAALPGTVRRSSCRILGCWCWCALRGWPFSADCC